MLLLAMTAMTAGAQSKLDLQSRAALRSMQTEAAQQGKLEVGAKAAAGQTTVQVLVRMKPGCDPQTLNGGAVKVIRSRGAFAAVELPLAEIGALNDNSAVESFTYKNEMKPMLDKATADAGVDRIRAMEDLTRTYTGKDVVVAVLDRYLDPNHPMFCDPVTHKTRVKMYVTDDLDLLETPEEMAAYVPSADVKSNDHGTHVTGIAAGYYDDGTYSCKGVATDADILMGNMSDKAATFMEIVEAFVDYAKSQHKPLVINMSVGIMAGPHDGTSEIASYIDKVSADGDAVFCVAAGNYGKFPSIQRHTFASDDEEMKSFVRWSADAPFEIWASDDRAFDVDFVLYDLKNNKAVRTYTIPEGLSTAQFSPMSESIELADIYIGSVYAERGLSKRNNRYNYWVSWKGTIADPANYLWGYIVHGKKGQNIMVTSSPYPLLVGRGIPGWGEGVEYGITNDLGSGTQPIVVGSYTTRESGTYADGTTYSTVELSDGEHDGEISPFSSYATYDTGRSYPHLCAPGSFLVSASSSYYMNNTAIAEESKPYVKKVDFDGKPYYFRAMQGTSMATPFMTGVAALWLEADPTLTAEKIRMVAENTARRDSYVTSSANQMQWGAGKIDAYAGLKYILNGFQTGISTAEGDKAFIYTAVADDTYEFCIAGSASLSAAVYNLQGQCVSAASAAGNSVTVSLASLPSGVYAVRVASLKGTHTVKLVKQ